MKISLILLSVFMLLIGCRNAEKTQSSYTAFTGANIIDGSGAQPISNAVLLVENGRVTNVGPRNAVTIPEGSIVRDVSGKTIIPGIINTHGHVGNAKGIEGGY